MKFKIGDIVRLKGSTPRMTVIKVDSSGIITCNWFINNDLKEGSFPEESLRLYKEQAIGILGRKPPGYFKGQRR